MIKYENVGYNQNISLETVNLPIYIYLELNNSCNLRCKFCSVSNKQNNYVEFSLIKKIMDELVSNNIFDVYYTGGEPLLHPDFDKIVKYASKLGIRQTLLTNGILLDKHKSILNNIMCVCISLHGSKQMHNELTSSDCYDKVISNIKLTKKYTNVKINYTVISDNQKMDEMINVLEFAKKSNISVSFSKYNNIGDGKTNNCYIDINEFVKTLDVLKNKGYSFGINDCIAPCTIDDKYLYLTHGCGAGYLFGSIDYNGNVKICPSSSNGIGNITKTKFKKIWNQKQMKEYRSLKWIPSYCKSCKNLTRCRCGCKVELGKDLVSLNDYIINSKMDSIWNKIINTKIKVNISMLRKEDNCYVSLSYPPRIYNYEAVEVLKSINNKIPLRELEEYKDFIIALYKDGIIEEEKENAKEETKKSKVFDSME